MPDPSSAPGKPASRKKQLVYGCLGCGGLVVVTVVVSFLLVVRWLKEVHVPVPGENVIGPDTVEAVVVDADPRSEGVADFVRALGQQIDQDRPEALDEKLRGFMRKFDKKDGAAILSSFLPLSFARVSTKGPLKDDPHPLTFVSLSHWANLLSRIGTKKAEADGWSASVHGDAFVYTHGQGDSAEAVCYRENCVFRGADAQTVGEAVDAAQKSAFPATGPLKELRDRLSARPTIWGLLVNKEDAAEREFGFLQGLSVSSKEVLGIAWEIDIQSAEKSTGRFDVKARDQGYAVDLQKQLIDRADYVRQALKDEHDLDTTFSARSDGQWVTVDFELKDFSRRIVKALAEGK